MLDIELRAVDCYILQNRYILGSGVYQKVQFIGSSKSCVSDYGKK